MGTSTDKSKIHRLNFFFGLTAGNFFSVKKLKKSAHWSQYLTKCFSFRCVYSFSLSLSSFWALRIIPSIHFCDCGIKDNVRSIIVFVFERYPPPTCCPPTHSMVERRIHVFPAFCTFFGSLKQTTKTAKERLSLHKNQLRDKTKSRVYNFDTYFP